MKLTTDAIKEKSQDCMRNENRQRKKSSLTNLLMTKFLENYTTILEEVGLQNLMYLGLVFHHSTKA